MKHPSSPEPSDLFRPLRAAELDELDRFLVSDVTSDETLTLAGLDGYLTALVIGPTTVMPSRWLPGVWGSHEDDAPEFESTAQAGRIMSLLLRHMNSIVGEFEADPAAFEPMFDTREYRGRDYVCGEAWASGFMQGVELVREDWQPLYDTAGMADAIRPLRLLSSAHLTPEEDLIRTPPKRERLARKIPQSLVEIHAFWLPYRAMAHAELTQATPVRRSGPKVGRNDPCPCGSGAKYKKCCGASETRH